MSSDYRELLADAVVSLELARHMLADEIGNYPTPISGCDAQFNHLLAERRRINDALRSISSDVFIATPRTPMPLSGVESR